MVFSYSGALALFVFKSGITSSGAFLWPSRFQFGPIIGPGLEEDPGISPEDLQRSYIPLVLLLLHSV